MNYSRSVLKIYLQWDEMAWSECLSLFGDIVKKQGITNGLEIAANKGGMSLFFANEFGISMRCTDLNNPEPQCQTIIALLQDPNMIVFDGLDALQMKLSDNSVDMLIFKSFLGGMRTYENQQKAAHEIYRVLKHGGVLLFAENLRGSCLHRFLRKTFIKWGLNWRYMQLDELHILFGNYKIKKIKSFGYFSAFSKMEFLRPAFYYLDKVLDFLIPASSKYIGYGFAIK